MKSTCLFVVFLATCVLDFYANAAPSGPLPGEVKTGGKVGVSSGTALPGTVGSARLILGGGVSAAGAPGARGPEAEIPGQKTGSLSAGGSGASAPGEGSLFAGGAGGGGLGVGGSLGAAGQSGGSLGGARFGASGLGIKNTATIGAGGGSIQASGPATGGAVAAVLQEGGTGQAGYGESAQEADLRQSQRTSLQQGTAIAAGSSSNGARGVTVGSTGHGLAIGSSDGQQQHGQQNRAVGDRQQHGQGTQTLHQTSQEDHANGVAASAEITHGGTSLSTGQTGLGLSPSGALTSTGTNLQRQTGLDGEGTGRQGNIAVGGGTTGSVLLAGGLSTGSHQTATASAPSAGHITRGATRTFQGQTPSGSQSQSTQGQPSGPGPALLVVQAGASHANGPLGSQDGVRQISQSSQNTGKEAGVKH